jgi:phytoene synthase
MTVEESYGYCETVARSRARNFYYSFVLLSPPQRRAMCAIYAFMRCCDDLSDDPAIADRAEAIERWRGDLTSALRGDLPGHSIWPAFRDSVRRFSIPSQYFYDMIEGVSSDLEPRRIETFDELYRYCYLVASVVGLTVVHIFGFEASEALGLAEKCGIAFQLTNILRDVREDALNDRVYLPGEDLRRFGVDTAALKSQTAPPGFVPLMRFEAARARRYYDESSPLIDMVHANSRPSLRALIEIYRTLLDRIEQSGFDVLSRRVRVQAWEKALIVVRSRFIPGWARTLAGAHGSETSSEPRR